MNTTIQVPEIFKHSEMHKALCDASGPEFSNTLQRFVGRALDDVRDEVIDAMSKHKPMSSPHEAYGVIVEELRELETETFKKNVDRRALRLEAKQLAAMAIRCMLDCT